MTLLVILAEVDPAKSKAFYGQHASHSRSGWPFSGVSIPAKVLHSVKGPLLPAHSHDIYFVRGGSCGVSSKSLPSRKTKYLLSGKGLTSLSTNHEALNCIQNKSYSNAYKFKQIVTMDIERCETLHCSCYYYYYY